MIKPTKLEANQILAKHGPAGWLIRRLQRYALLGWVLFFIVLILHFATQIIGNFVPRPIVAVDASGRVLGNIEYLNAGTRSDDDIIAASKRFASLYLSLNADTIFEDYAQAMNMMGDEMLAATRQSLKTDNYLARVAAAKARSWLEFSQPDGARILERHGLAAQVRLAGNIVVDGGGKNKIISKPFDMTLTIESVARNTSNTSGIKILSRKDN